MFSIMLRLSSLTLFLVHGNDPRPNPFVIPQQNPPNGFQTSRSANDPQDTSRIDQGTQPLEQEALPRRNQTQHPGVQSQTQSSAVNGQRMNYDSGDSIVIDNNSRLQSPFQHGQEMPFSFNDSPLPPLPDDVFADPSRFDDDRLRDMGHRTDFYDNLNFVLSGSYE
jgi:hypothetical protein